MRNARRKTLDLYLETLSQVYIDKDREGRNYQRYQNSQIHAIMRLIKRICSVLVLFITIRGVGSSDDQYLDPQMRQLEMGLLDTLCPAVDICDLNATSADIEPNKPSARGFVPCCKGCSCHPDCRENHNCCYKEGDTRNDDGNTSMYKCVRPREGQPKADIPTSMPGYVTVVTAPRNGCVDNKPFKIGRGPLVYPTCDKVDNISLIIASTPVYSADTDNIYKNVLCARCQGVTSMTPFDPYLVCKKKDENGKFVSFSEQFRIFETGILSKNCYADFIYVDKTVISSKECYVDVISTCETSEVNSSYADIVENVGLEMIQYLCKSGVYSPTYSDTKMYRNVFCALCGREPFYKVLCRPEFIQRVGSAGFAHLLDNKKLYTEFAKSADISLPEVCLKAGNIEVPGSCRELYCSSGKVRQANGKCAFASKALGVAGVLLTLKLIPKERQDSIRRRGQSIDSQDVIEAILDGKTFPDGWRVFQVFARHDISECAEQGEFLIWLHKANGESFEKLNNDIKTSMKRLWILQVNGSSLRFLQTFQEYPFENAGSFIVPFWEKFPLRFNTTALYRECDSIQMKRIYTEGRFSAAPVMMNKLILCEQIQLNPDEFNLGVGEGKYLYLESNLTRRLLYGQEFDLVSEDEYYARVCVSDTLFSRKKSQTSAGSLATLKVAEIVMYAAAVFIVNETV